ncbi:MAG TPA: CDP-diacylglycerol--serine O-phosphatidyltransferase [Cytophagales bacterium]|nr:CDP-diacylglycerol--serine O-phosphatidyltransferase [Cytophagales bacterium]HAP58601.1 CDP-diacylglycerol--serine O-phosphatidyltransferase [Cytophagales bacterium]
MPKSQLIQNIPNVLTLSNLVLGCVGILAAAEGQLQQASACIGLAMVADFLDGFVARLLKVQSPIGADLDSLADMVTFGVLPGILMYWLLLEAGTGEFTPYLGLVLPVGAAVRLAVFNNDPSQAHGFRGVPTPLVALVVGALPFIRADYPRFFTVPVLLVVSVSLALLMVSRLPLMALKFKSFAFRPNALKYLFLLLSAASLVLLQFLAVPLIFGLYLTLSLANRSSEG